MGKERLRRKELKADNVAVIVTTRRRSGGRWKKDRRGGRN